MTSSPRPPWAARRDASARSRRPRTNHALRLHVADESGLSCCGGELLDDDSPMRLVEVPDRLRCRRAGCRKHWPAAAEQQATAR